MVLFSLKMMNALLLSDYTTTYVNRKSYSRCFDYEMDESNTYRPFI